MTEYTSDKICLIDIYIDKKQRMFISALGTKTNKDMNIIQKSIIEHKFIQLYQDE
jgi:hypothetical protein